MAARHFPLLAVVAATATVASSSTTTAASPSPLRGFVYTSYSATGYLQPASDATIPELVQSGVQVVELMHTRYVANSVNATQIYAAQNSPTDAAILHALGQLKKNGLRIAFKPHIDCADGIWRANIGVHFTTEAQWAAWFSNYTAFLLHSVALAQQAGGVDFFNVGTELDGTHPRVAEWLAVIAAVRSALPTTTKLWLGPNWEWNGRPGYELVDDSIWAALDFLGVDMYAPLASHPNPSLAEAVAGWAPLVANLSAFSQAHGGKGFIFAEMGYASFQDAAVNAPACCSGPPDPTTQAVLYQSFFTAVWTQPWMAGAFWWAWPETQPEGDPCGTGFDVWRKPAGLVLSTAYGGSVKEEGEEGAAATGRAHTSPSRAAAAPAGARGPAPLVLYSNGVRSWEDYSWNATRDWSDKSDPYPGHASSASLSLPYAGQGAVTLHFPGPGEAVDASPFSALEFDVIVPNATNGAELAAWLCACADCTKCGTLPSATLVEFVVAEAGKPLTCTLAQDWAADPAPARVSIPLATLGLTSANSSVARVQIGSVWGGWSPVSFSVDNVQFV
jgi:hypothetical protein